MSKALNQLKEAEKFSWDTDKLDGEVEIEIGPSYKAGYNYRIQIWDKHVVKYTCDTIEKPKIVRSGK